MIYSVYSIRDNVADGFLTPMIDQNDNVAIRNFEHACMNNNSLFFTHSKDYDLYKIGEFDSDIGVIKAFGIPKHVFSGSQIKKGDSDNE